MRPQSLGALSTVSAVLLAALLSPFFWLYRFVTFEEWRLQKGYRRRALAWGHQYEALYEEKLRCLKQQNPVADAEAYVFAESPEKEQLWSQFRSRIEKVVEDPDLWEGTRLLNAVYNEWQEASLRYNIAFRERLSVLAVRPPDALP